MATIWTVRYKGGDYGKPLLVHTLLFGPAVVEFGGSGPAAFGRYLSDGVNDELE